MDPREAIAGVARLARLELEPSERERIASQLGDILRHFESIRALPTGGVAPLVHATAGADVFRPDETLPSIPRDELLSNAPEPLDGFFGVPKVVEG